MTLQGKELDELLVAMRGAAERAGAYLAGGLDQPKHIEHKGPVNLIHQADWLYSRRGYRADRKFLVAGERNIRNK